MSYGVNVLEGEAESIAYKMAKYQSIKRNHVVLFRDVCGQLSLSYANACSFRYLFRLTLRFIV